MKTNNLISKYKKIGLTTLHKKKRSILGGKPFTLTFSDKYWILSK